MMGNERDNLPMLGWHDEVSRWRELAACILIAGLRVDASMARKGLQVLTEMSMTSVDFLASAGEDDRRLMVKALERAGVELAERFVVVITALAQRVEVTWQGYVQKFLRQQGEAMVAALQEELATIGLGRQELGRAAALWLQNVANMPILVPGDPATEGFRRRYKLSTDDLLRSADELGINVALIDDLVMLDAIRRRGEIAARETGSVPA